MHVSSLYRWELVQDEVSMDPLQTDILEQLARKLRTKPAAAKKVIGDELLAALLAGGALLGLAVLLAFITGEKRDKKRRRR